MTTNISQTLQKEVEEAADQIIQTQGIEKVLDKTPGFKVIRHTETASGEALKTSAHAVVEYRGEHFYLVQTS